MSDNGNGNNLSKGVPGNPGWKKGQSGNPSGRPSRPKYFTEALLSRLEANPQIAYDFIDQLFTMVLEGNRLSPAVAEMLWSRLEGPITASIAQGASTNVNSPVIIIPANGRETMPDHYNNGNGNGHLPDDAFEDENG